MYFKNRCEAGRRLARKLASEGYRDPVVLALPRGGVPVGYEVAHQLEAPLEVLVASKIGAPGRPEFAIGAVAPHTTYYDEECIRLLGVPREYVREEENRVRRATTEAMSRYRANPLGQDVRGKTAIIVDDGIATGATAIAAARAARDLGAEQVVVAAPVCSPEARRRLADEVDSVTYLEAPADFGAVGFWYEDFSQTTDREVLTLLKRALLEREAHYHGSR